MTLEDKEDALIGLTLKQAEGMYPDLDISPILIDGELAPDGGNYTETAVELQDNIIVRILE